MRVVFIIVNLKDGQCYIGAMVCHTLKHSQDILKAQSQLNRTLALPKPLHVTSLNLLSQPVHHKLKRHNLTCGILIGTDKHIDGSVNNLLHS